MCYPFCVIEKNNFFKVDEKRYNEKVQEKFSEKAPQNFIEMFMYQNFLDSKINNIKERKLFDIKISFLAELVEFNEETPETHKTWKARVIDNEKILEELTDVYFFLAQIINHIYKNNMNIFKDKTTEEKDKILNNLENFYRIDNRNVYDDKQETLLLISETVSSKELDIYFLIKLMAYFTNLYGFTKEDILKCYYEKWKKNLKRIGTEWR